MADKKEADGLFELETYESLLIALAKKSLKPEARHYFQYVNRSCRVKQIKWYVFAAIMTLFLELQLRVLFPDTLQLHAAVVLLVGCLICFALWILENFFRTKAGDPANVYSKHEDVERGNVVSRVENAIVQSYSNSPTSSKDQTNLGALLFTEETVHHRVVSTDAPAFKTMLSPGGTVSVTSPTYGSRSKLLQGKLRPGIPGYSATKDR